MVDPCILLHQPIEQNRPAESVAKLEQALRVFESLSQSQSLALTQLVYPKIYEELKRAVARIDGFDYPIPAFVELWFNCNADPILINQPVS